MSWSGILWNVDVRLTPEAADEAAELPRTIKPRIFEIVDRLRRWPNVSGAKALKGPFSGQWRIRTGDYRVQFVVGHGQIMIVKVGHRDKFYER